MNYYSRTYITCNEAGDREVQFEFHRTFLDWLLRRPAKKLIFVQTGRLSTVWYHKGTGKRACVSDEIACMEAIEHSRQLAVYMKE